MQTSRHKITRRGLRTQPASGRGEVIGRKPVLLACLAYGGALQQEKPRVAYVRSGNVAFCLKTDTYVVTLTFEISSHVLFLIRV